MPGLQRLLKSMAQFFGRYANLFERNQPFPPADLEEAKQDVLRRNVRGPQTPSKLVRACQNLDCTGSQPRASRHADGARSVHTERT
jgi:hypothetical protein